MDKSLAMKKALAIDGWLDPKEASELYDLAKSATGPIIEIGSWKGRSTTALALGSMAGNRQTIYAVDSFKGSMDSEVQKKFYEGHTIGKEILRSNLDAAGVNGCVQIIEADAAEVADSLPEASLIFVDGAHDYQSVCRDLDVYSRKVSDGGMLACHDYHEGPVESAVNEKIHQNKSQWIPCGVTYTTYLASRRLVPEQRNVMLAMPGGNIQWQTVQSVLNLADGYHFIEMTNSGNGWDDFNAVWCSALNAYAKGRITHFVQLHSDIAPRGNWLDLLLDDLDRHSLDMVSAICPIKDTRGVTSSGIGDPNNKWEPWRRFTMHEVCEQPLVFDAATFGYEGWPLVHNTGCFACDLRNPLFSSTEPDGTAKIYFDFPSKVYQKENGEFDNRRESEDWYFSRKLHELGGKSAITRRVRLSHRGVMDFNNFEPWGSFTDGDADTAAKWKTATT